MWNFISASLFVYSSVQEFVTAVRISTFIVFLNLEANVYGLQFELR